MSGLVLLLAVAACTESGATGGDNAAPAEPSTAAFGPLPQFSGQYRAPLRPFARCAVRLLARKRTVKPAYDEEARLARLVAYDTQLDGRFLYELDLWQRPDDTVLAELRVGAVSLLRNWGGEVSQVLERCETALNPPTPPHRPPAEDFPRE